MQPYFQFIFSYNQNSKWMKGRNCSLIWEVESAMLAMGSEVRRREFACLLWLMIRDADRKREEIKQTEANIQDEEAGA